MSMWNTFWNAALSLFSAPEREKCKIKVNNEWCDGIVIAEYPGATAHDNSVDVQYSGETAEGTMKKVRRGSSARIQFSLNKEQEALSHKRPLLFKKYKTAVSSSDSRPIISRIGRIKIHKRSDQYPVYATATIFDYDDKNQIVFAITSAHNLFGNDIATIDIKLEFQRLEEATLVDIYPCNFKVHKQYQNDANDIVILRFKDKNNHYQKIFSNEEQKSGDEDWNKINIVDIYESDKIDCSFYVPFKMLVYDEDGNLLELINKCNEDDGNVDEDDSDEKKDAATVKHYFRKTKDEKQFEYNSIVGGEIRKPYIGAAIITELTGGPIRHMRGGKYGIVGIYTGEKALKNTHGIMSAAVALNQEKCAWIDDAKLEMLAPSDFHKS